ncbi:hypothetical protein J2X83_004174 [Brevibacillus nitrificans]|nr:hypothetical protein [Brevibacillus nitrificans]
MACEVLFLLGFHFHSWAHYPYFFIEKSESKGGER